MAGKTEILGIGELKRAFDRLRDVDRGARRVVVAGGQVLKRKARGIAQANGHRRTGALINNIVIKRERTPSGEVQYNLGVRHGRGLTRKQKQSSYLAVGSNGRIVTRYENDPYYWRFVEFGTGGHKIAARGKAVAWAQVPKSTRFARVVEHPGVQASPFIGPALDEGKGDAIAAMERALIREVDRQAKGGR